MNESLLKPALMVNSLENTVIAVSELDAYIENYRFDSDEIKEINADRPEGKKTKFEIGTICVYHDYILTALSKFNRHNEAYLTMPEYLGFLINFGTSESCLRSEKRFCTNLWVGSSPELKVIKLSMSKISKDHALDFRISEMRFKHPAKLTIMIHEGKIDKVNL
jgi:hypothetical protein